MTKRALWNLQKRSAVRALVCLGLCLMLGMGSAMAESAVPPVGSGVSIEEYAAQMEKLVAEKGPEWTWSLEDKAEYLGDAYGLPGEGDLAEEEAIRIAGEAVIEAYGISADELSKYTPCLYFYVQDEEFAPPFWFVNFYDDVENPVNAYSAVIAAKTGEVLQTYGPEDVSNG